MKASVAIPPFFRLMLTTIEPLTAINGAFLAIYNPAKLTAMMTRGNAAAAPTPATAYLYTSLAAAWLFFAVMGAGILRMVDNVRVWRLLCAAMLVSDVPFTLGLVQAVGGWTQWADIGQWGAEEWGSNVITIGMLVIRVCVVLGVGCGCRW